MSKLLRLAYRLPWHCSLARDFLTGKSEISLEEARFLSDLVRRTPAHRPIIEIGTLFGASTRVITLAKHNDTRLVTVDSFRWNPYRLTPKQHEGITRAALADALSTFNVELVVSDKQEFYDSYRGPKPALVFLDANHS